MLVVLVVLVASVATGAGSVSGPAGAANCNLTCGAYAYWTMMSPSGTLGAKVTLRANCFVLPDPSSDYAYHSLTVKQSSLADNRIQLGIYYKPSSAASPRRYFSFINDDDSGFFYSQHDYDFDAALTATIWKPSDGTSDFEMWFDNTVNHSKAPNILSGPARYMAAGLALRDNATRTFASASRLYYYNLGGAITPEWSGSSSNALLYAYGAPMYANWVNNDWWAQMGQGATC